MKKEKKKRDRICNNKKLFKNKMKKNKKRERSNKKEMT